MEAKILKTTEALKYIPTLSPQKTNNQNSTIYRFQLNYQNSINIMVLIKNKSLPIMKTKK